MAAEAGAGWTTDHSRSECRKGITACGKAKQKPQKGGAEDAYRAPFSACVPPLPLSMGSIRVTWIVAPVASANRPWPDT